VHANVSALNASARRHLAEKTIVDPLGVGQIHADCFERRLQRMEYDTKRAPSL
jgi:hypothetical protein